MKKPLKTAEHVFELFAHLDRACAHHATSLTNVWPRVFATLTRYAESIQVSEKYTNQAWITIGDRPYAVAANRDPFTKHYSIVVKARSNRGAVLARFDETSTPQAIEAAFKALKAAAHEQAA